MTKKILYSEYLEIHQGISKPVKESNASEIINQFFYASFNLRCPLAVSKLFAEILVII